ncbi:FAD:protein FMN transferase [Siphonobacter sp.]|uniref:FAD:protein FMN transferase n=1 Tax=Siphonobacter sp. TaxID=1869184 RepID=UPI003B3B79B4
MKKLLLFVGLVLVTFSTQAQARKLIFQQPKMGSMFTVQVWTADSVQAAQAATLAFAAVDSLNLIFSDYLPDSELSRLSQTAGSGKAVPVSPALWDILWTSRMAWEKSSKTFDVTVGQLTQLWRQSRKSKQLPSPAVRQKALTTTGTQYLQFDEKNHTIQLKRPGTKLDLGAIGKGYAAQRMLEIMQKAGFEESLCDAAGNMAIGKNPDAGWTVGIELPNQQGELLASWLVLQQMAISTSGDAYQAVRMGGKNYSHIVSPKTGLGVTYQRQVTVLSKDAAQADWLSTACYLLPVPQALKLAESEQSEILILDNQPSGLKTFTSPGFKKFFKEE